MRRAEETAAIIGDGLGLPIRALDDLCERAPGECEGMTISEYRGRYGREPADDGDDPLSPGGEALADFLARAAQAVLSLADVNVARTTWIVCHAGIITATASALMQTPHGPGAPCWANPEPTALAEWERSGADAGQRAWTLRRYNDVAHLLGDDGTGP